MKSVRSPRIASGTIASRVNSPAPQRPGHRRRRRAGPRTPSSGRPSRRTPADGTARQQDQQRGGQGEGGQQRQREPHRDARPGAGEQLEPGRPHQQQADDDRAGAGHQGRERSRPASPASSRPGCRGSSARRTARRGTGRSRSRCRTGSRSGTARPAARSPTRPGSSRRGAPRDHQADRRSSPAGPAPARTSGRPPAGRSGAGRRSRRRRGRARSGRWPCSRGRSPRRRSSGSRGPAGSRRPPRGLPLQPGDRLVRDRRDERRRERHGDQLRRCRPRLTSRSAISGAEPGPSTRSTSPGRSGASNRRASRAANCLSASVSPPARCSTATTIDSYDWSGQHWRTSSAARRLSAPPASIRACPSAASRVRSGDSTPTIARDHQPDRDHPARPADRQELDQPPSSCQRHSRTVGSPEVIPREHTIPDRPTPVAGGLMSPRCLQPRAREGLGDLAKMFLKDSLPTIGSSPLISSRYCATPRVHLHTKSRRPNSSLGLKPLGETDAIGTDRGTGSTDRSPLREESNGHRADPCSPPRAPDPGRRGTATACPGGRDEQSHRADVGARHAPRAGIRAAGRAGLAAVGSTDDRAEAAGSPAVDASANKARTEPASRRTVAASRPTRPDGAGSPRSIAAGTSATMVATGAGSSGSGSASPIGPGSGGAGLVVGISSAVGSGRRAGGVSSPSSRSDSAPTTLARLAARVLDARPHRPHHRGPVRSASADSCRLLSAWTIRSSSRSFDCSYRRSRSPHSVASNDSAAIASASSRSR